MSTQLDQFVSCERLSRGLSVSVWWVCTSGGPLAFGVAALKYAEWSALAMYL